MDERRYDDEEVRQIFGAASHDERSEDRRTASSPAEGMTLAELQEIGSEVGLAPERIAQAASSLEARRGVQPRTTRLGLPIGVGRTVELARAPSDREWDLLVTELRETFGARGHVSVHGGIREWSNGNLFASIEPTESGHRLRLGTRSRQGAGLTALGTFLGAWVAILAVASVLTGGFDAERISGLVTVALLGGGALGAAALRLPRWAGEREEQMEHIAGRALALLSAPGDEHEP